jgi:non-ribosomal peptide synthase protein (TIGR01720 family)
VIDNFSWTILLEDLEVVCRQLLDHQSPALPSQTTSITQWVRRLTQYAQTPDCESSIDYWLSPNESYGAIPRDFETKKPVDEASARFVTVELDESKTQDLISNVHDIYGTQTQDLLIAAFAKTVASFVTLPNIQFDLEGHGREPIQDSDLSRTVGWFTSFFPIAFDMASINENDSGSLIKCVKEKIRTLPNRGLNFGVTRYLCENEDIVNQLRRKQSNEVLFNFAGVESPESTNGIFTPTKNSEQYQLEASARASCNERSHPVEVSVFVANKRLTMTWIYSQLLHEESTTRNWSNRFKLNLVELVNHCKTADTKEFTASDFPDSGMDQSDLDAFLDGLD